MKVEIDDEELRDLASRVRFLQRAFSNPEFSEALYHIMNWLISVWAKERDVD